ncbi:Cupin domain protein [Rhizobium mongolense subsp. loessense]|uniref:Cupin domain protein n=1 Tax=Rhizobium mongolense subsp. loessense TaxID=158890 RepID=A0A1G4T9F5_9HYPH|nr:Cupin domain protein [Rhizobium mongolense subsp. loessense]
MIKSIFAALSVTALLSGMALADDTAGGKESKVTLVYKHELPNVPGKSIKGVLVEYGPGGFSEGRTHPSSVLFMLPCWKARSFGQVNDSPVKEHKAGESFSKLPSDRHAFPKNGSEGKPAKLLARLRGRYQPEGTDLSHE